MSNRSMFANINADVDFEFDMVAKAKYEPQRVAAIKAAQAAGAAESAAVHNQRAAARRAKLAAR